MDLRVCLHLLLIVNKLPDTFRDKYIYFFRNIGFYKEYYIYIYTLVIN